MDEELRAVLEARAMLEALTPLRDDCGRLCEAACCQGDAETGMLLFPGEAELYAEGGEWYHLLRVGNFADLFGEPPTLLVCTKPCPREARPLACRIFPLTPYFAKKRMDIRMDRRATGMCPLLRSGTGGLRRDFVQSVTAAMETLYPFDCHRAHMLGLTKLIQQSDPAQLFAAH